MAITAEILKFAVRPPCDIVCPPTSDPSEMPRKRALLFQARTVARWSGKIFCKAGLLSREKQLRRRRGRCKGESDEYSGINRKLDEEKTHAKTDQADSACQLCSQPIYHASTNQHAADCPASIEQNSLGDVLV
jgi:hypothetical protein